MLTAANRIQLARVMNFKSLACMFTIDEFSFGYSFRLLLMASPMLRYPAAIPIPKPMNISHGDVPNLRSSHSPQASPMKMESATERPMLLKKANSLNERAVSFFMQKNASSLWAAFVPCRFGISGTNTGLWASQRKMKLPAACGGELHFSVISISKNTYHRILQPHYSEISRASNTGPSTQACR